MKPDYRGSWIAVYSKTLESGDFKRLTCIERSVFFQALLLASRKERDFVYRHRTYHLQPGQFVISQRDLVELCGKGCSRNVVRSTIAKLIASNTLTQDSTHFSTQHSTQSPMLLTFINWSSYQFISEIPPTNLPTFLPTLPPSNGIKTQSATSGKKGYTVFDTLSLDTQTRSLEDMSSSETFQSEKAEQGEKQEQQKQEQAKKKSAELEKAYDVLSYLNKKADHRYEMRPNSVINILARLRDGATVEDLKLIIDYKVNEWGQKSEFRKNLNNETLFRACHYSTYLEDAKQWQRAKEQERQKIEDDAAIIKDGIVVGHVHTSDDDYDDPNDHSAVNVHGTWYHIAPPEDTEEEHVPSRPNPALQDIMRKIRGETDG